MKRILRSFALAVLAMSSISLTAQNPQFQNHEYPVGAAAQAVDEGDFNHDGISDLVTADGASNSVSVLLGQGQGKFGAATHFATGANPVGVIAVDVNHDGKFDIATVNHDSNSVSVLLGNGDGTFAPRHDILVGVGPNSITAGDFNKDGNTDFAVANGTSKTISILLGDGHGNFSVSEFDASHYTPFPQYSGGDTFSSIASIKVGDFNGDGKTDLAYIGCCADSGTDPGTHGVIRVLAGDGTGGFSPLTQTVAILVYQEISASDINHDGYTDIVTAGKGSCGEPSCSELHVFMNSKAPPYFDQPIYSYNFTYPHTSGGNSPFCVDENCGLPFSPHVGDFNGDGINDIAVVLPQGTKVQNPGSDYPYDWPYDWVLIFPGKTDGTFDDPQGILLGQHKIDYNAAGLVIKDFDKDGKLDIAVTEAQAQNVAVLLNSTAPSCAVPSTIGVKVCAPAAGSTVTSPVHFSAAFNLPGTPYRFEVWRQLTGEKLINLRDTNMMDMDLPMDPGDYTLTFIAKNTAGAQQQAQVHFTVGQGTGGACPPPSSDGVNVCAPAANASVSSPVDIFAGAKITGGVYRFDLWVDHVKTFSVRDSGDMRTSQAMNPGSHLLEFVAQNAAGAHVTTSRTITVPGAGTCAPPTSPGVVICQPTDNQGVSRTFNVQAFAKLKGSVYRFELWAGSTKVLTVRDSGTMNSSVTLAPGNYTLQFVAQDSTGTDRQVKTVHVTVFGT